MSNYTETFLNYMPTLLSGLALLFIGLFLASMLSKLFESSMNKKEIEKSLVTFLVSAVKITLKIAVFISVLGVLGIQTTSFIALLGSAGLAVGLALQGSLANFAGGVLILFLKPFKVGDVITAQGFTGSVDAISLFITCLKTPDNKRILLPNGPLSNGSIVNISSEPTRRVDFTFGVGYEDNLKEAKDLILKTITSDSRVLLEPKAFIAVSELADSSVNFTVRVWAKKEDYWGIYFDGIENVKIELDKNNFNIPYPQTTVHLQNNRVE